MAVVLNSDSITKLKGCIIDNTICCGPARGTLAVKRIGSEYLNISRVTDIAGALGRSVRAYGMAESQEYDLIDHTKLTIAARVAATRGQLTYRF